jgi:hypothetical protein
MIEVSVYARSSMTELIWKSRVGVISILIQIGKQDYVALKLNRERYLLRLLVLIKSA